MPYPAVLFFAYTFTCAIVLLRTDRSCHIYASAHPTTVLVDASQPHSPPHNMSSVNTAAWHLTVRDQFLQLNSDLKLPSYFDQLCNLDQFRMVDYWEHDRFRLMLKDSHNAEEAANVIASYRSACKLLAHIVATCANLEIVVEGKHHFVGLRERSERSKHSPESKIPTHSAVTVKKRAYSGTVFTCQTEHGRRTNSDRC